MHQTVLLSIHRRASLHFVNVCFLKALAPGSWSATLWPLWRTNIVYDLSILSVKSQRLEHGASHVTAQRGLLPQTKQAQEWQREKDDNPQNCQKDIPLYQRAITFWMAFLNQQVL